MANNCSFTKLLGSVENDNLDILGAFDISISSINAGKLKIYSLVSQKVELLEGSSSQSVGGEITIPANQEFVIYGTSNAIKLRITDKYAIKGVREGSSAVSQVSLNIDKFKKCENLEYIDFPTISQVPTITGNLSSLSGCTNLKSLIVRFSGITGDLHNLSNLVNLENIRLTDSQITGDISVFGNMSNLTNININGTGIYGSLESIVKGQVSNGNTSGSISWGYLKYAPNVTFNGSNPATTGTATLSWEPNATAGRTDVTYNSVTITIDNTTGNVVS